MKIYLSYKTELKLNNKQKTLINKAIGIARFAYNWGLDNRKTLWESQRKSISYYDQSKLLNSIKDAQFPWMREVSKCAPQYALEDLDNAYKNFFKKKTGYPKFKSKHDSKQSFRLVGQIKVFNDRIKLPRLGEIRLKQSGYIPIDKKILSATVSKHAGRFFVSVSVESEIEVPVNLSDKIIGVDLGIKHLAVTSEGVYFENPKTYRRFLKKLKRLQRSHSRKIKGSNNRKKSQFKLAKLHYKIANIRKDTIHKMTSSLVKTKPKAIVIEDLSPKNMIKNRRLAMSLSDCSFSEIRRQLEYKTKWAGVELVMIDRFFPSSKICSSCGAKKTDLTLSDRIYKCDCGLILDRDLNAAINLKNTVGFTGINASG